MLRICFLIWFFLCGIFLSSNAIAEISSPVNQVLFSPQIRTIAMIIKGLPHIDNIVTAGKYAWAVDSKDALVAFYNGNTWKPAQNIPGITESASVYPSFLTSGASPEAWLMSTSNLEVGALISHFDGNQWSSAQLASKILNVQNNYPADPFPQYNLYTAGNVAYLIAWVFKPQLMSTEMIYSTYSPKQKAWLPPRSLFTDDSLGMNIYSDETSGLYFINYSSKQPSLDKIDKTGEIQTIYNLALPAFSSAIYMDEKKLYIFYQNSSYNSSTQAASNNLLSPKWQTVNLGQPTDGIGVYWPYKMKKGMLCQDIYDVSNNLSFSCINLNESEPQWTTPFQIAQNTSNWQIIAHEDGAWIAYRIRDYVSHVLDFDYASNQIVDTHFPFTDYDAGFVLLKNVDSGAVIGCINQSKYSGPYINLYYYNRNALDKNWQALDTSTTKVTGCAFSNSGNGWHLMNGLNLKAGETLWVFKKEQSFQKEKLDKQLPRNH